MKCILNRYFSFITGFGRISFQSDSFSLFYELRHGIEAGKFDLRKWILMLQHFSEKKKDWWRRVIYQFSAELRQKKVKSTVITKIPFISNSNRPRCTQGAPYLAIHRLKTPFFIISSKTKVESKWKPHSHYHFAVGVT